MIDDDDDDDDDGHDNDQEDPDENLDTPREITFSELVLG